MRTYVNSMHDWSVLSRILFRFCFVFILLFIISFPTTHHYIPDISKQTSSLFEGIIKWFGDHVLGLTDYNPGLISDATGLYIHVLILILFSVLSTITWSVFNRKKEHEPLLYFLLVVIRYYLAMQLLWYGFNKIFKYQFYLPEPNILYTKMGEVPRDLLYWSAMGTSRAYNIFMGGTEVFAALLLLFRRTQLMGALLAFAVLINVVCVNFSFDISVKVYSCFLLLLSIAVIAPHLKRLWYFFVLRESTTQRAWIIVYHSTFQYRMYMWIKAVVIFLLLADSLSPYAEAGYFNDDKMPRPFLHGAYQVKNFKLNGNILDECNTQRWKRMFIHRDGYFIIQNQQEEMNDYKLEYNKSNRQLHLEDYYHNKSTLHYILPTDTTLELNGVFYGDTIQASFKKLDWKKMPLLQNEFHWVIE
jgi:hypothetical protein